jgi:hypothetical protein
MAQRPCSAAHSSAGTSGGFSFNVTLHGFACAFSLGGMLEMATATVWAELVWRAGEMK